MMAKQASVMALCCMLCVLSTSSVSHALIMGGTGNAPLHDPGWPAGAEQVFNTQARIAWWEGPPFGGGQWHSECQGNAQELSKFLADFAKIEGVPKRVIVQDGVGHSFWLDPNRDKAKSRETEVDWTLVIWQKDKWQFQKQLPCGVSALAGNAESEPAAEVHVFTGGAIKWADVRVPQGIEVIDQTLEGHGFKANDGRVVEGTLTDAQSKKPLVAQVTLEKIQPKAEGGYTYEAVTKVGSDSMGHWVMKKLPAGWFRIVARCEGYAPGIFANLKVDEQSGWQDVSGALIQSASVRGKVVDASGQPLAGAVVRLDDALYESPDGYQATSNDQGEFEIPVAPRGKVTLHVYRKGYTRRGLGPSITIPCEPLKLEMEQAGSIKVHVTSAEPIQGGYMVNLRDARGDAVGRFGGGGNINANNVMVFSEVPPGKYLVSGQPNPGRIDQKTGEVEITVVGGKETSVELQAK